MSARIFNGTPGAAGPSSLSDASLQPYQVNGRLSMISRFKNNLAIAMAVAALISGTFASAQTGFNGNKAIIGLDVGDTGELIIRFDSNLGCGSPLAKISRNQIYYSDMYAMALTAQANSKPINVYVGSCEAEYSRVIRMTSGIVF